MEEMNWVIELNNELKNRIRRNIGRAVQSTKYQLASKS
jgi:hypothetical protein